MRRKKENTIKIEETKRGGKMSKNKIALLLGIVCIALTFAICVQLKTIELANKTVSSSFTENQLRDEVLKWKERYENAYKDLQVEEAKLEKVRKKATENDETSGNIRQELKMANRLLGFTELKGKGVTITLEDNKLQSVEGVTTGNITDYIVHDDDLISLVNEIKNATSVDAISINNQRIVSTTGITCDGNVVRINGQKVSAPYVINAIGSPEGIMGALTSMLGSYFDTLQKVGVVKKIEKSNSITVPKYKGVISIEHLMAGEK